jgi:nitroreductase
MQVPDAIATLRAVRTFSDRAIEADRLESIVEAGRLAPSSNNDQSREFIVCTDREHLIELSALGDWTAHLAGAAAGIAVVTPNSSDAGEREIIAFDAGQAVQNMLLAAWGLGIGGVHGSVYVEPEARRLLGYPVNMRCDLVMSFGYPPSEEKPARQQSGSRRPYNEVVHEERW